jgi:hypothetical protein
MNKTDLLLGAWRKSSRSESESEECVEVAPAAWRKSSRSGSDQGECVEVAHATWRKSTHSADSSGQCVEVAGVVGLVAVRDSKNPDGPILTFSAGAWHALLTDLKSA